MKRLIYISSARHALKTSHINDILATSRERNLGAGLTGLLVFHDGTFFQVLEGSEADVMPSFDRIRRDWRHTDCRILFNEPVAERAFAEWSMAYRLASDLDQRQVRQLRDIREVVAGCESGDYAAEPAMDVFLRAFLAGFSLLDAA